VEKALCRAIRGAILLGIPMGLAAGPLGRNAREPAAARSSTPADGTRRYCVRAPYPNGACVRGGRKRGRIGGPAAIKMALAKSASRLAPPVATPPISRRVSSNILGRNGSHSFCRGGRGRALRLIDFAPAPGQPPRRAEAGRSTKIGGNDRVQKRPRRGSGHGRRARYKVAEGRGPASRDHAIGGAALMDARCHEIRAKMGGVYQ